MALIAGDEIPADRTRGWELLQAAARRGDRVAAIVLKGDTGDTWAEDGFYIYNSSLTVSDTPMASRLREHAGRCFLRGHQQGDPACSTNLAYLVRRGELSGEDFPSLDDLLRTGLAAGNEFARMNQALRLARGVQCDVDWLAADRLVASLRGSRRIAEWWQPLAAWGDSEGELVLWWLARHGLTVAGSETPPMDWDVPILP